MTNRGKKLPRNYDFINDEHNCCKQGRETGDCDHIRQSCMALDTVRAITAERDRFANIVDNVTVLCSTWMDRIDFRNANDFNLGRLAAFWAVLEEVRRASR